MIDPSKDPILSIVTTGNHLQACLELLKQYPVADINRSLSPTLEGIDNVGDKEAGELDEGNNKFSILELFLANAPTHPLVSTDTTFDANASTAPLSTLVAIELIKQGASVHNTGTQVIHGETISYDLLDWAFNYGHYTLVEYLLAGPLQSKIPTLLARRDQSGRPWLLSCMQSDQWGLANLLLKNGADVNECNTSGNTALFYCDNEASVKKIVLAGADPSIVNKSGETAVDYWGKKLLAPQVKKMSSTLFKVMKDNGLLDVSAAQNTWMNSVLSANKGVLMEQGKRLNVDANFVWQHKGVTVLPLVWMMTNHGGSRTFSIEERIVEYLSPGIAAPLMTLPTGQVVDNLDVLALLDVCSDHFKSINIRSGWHPDGKELGHMLEQIQSHEDDPQWTATVVERLVAAAMALQILPWNVPQKIAQISFEIYCLFLNAPTDTEADFGASALALSLSRASNRNIKKEHVQSALDCLRTTPLKTDLENHCLEHARFSKPYHVYVLSETCCPLLNGSNDPVHLRKALWPLVKDFSHRYYSDVNNALRPFPVQRSNPFASTANLPQSLAFQKTVEQVIAQLNDRPELGNAFTDKQWKEIQKGIDRDSSSLKDEWVKNMRERLETLIQKATIHRQIVQGPSLGASKRKI